MAEESAEGRAEGRLPEPICQRCLGAKRVMVHATPGTPLGETLGIHGSTRTVFIGCPECAPDDRTTTNKP